ncbi:MAG: cobalt-precorrin-6A reductase [Leptolyngbyaceae cyanobacterium T60_A2020_046]|nr:cobalt-precorrin-6A reductase [Leptolyngbyaceae cyanobacterium T60_A2020_046]
MLRIHDPTIWLIGGTEESRHLVSAIAAQPERIPPTGRLLISVTTEAARNLYPTAPWLEVWVGKLTPAIAPQFFQHYAPQAIIDASHPFAVEVSQRAIALAQQAGVPYLRYERPGIEAGDRPPAAEPTDTENDILYCDRLEAALIRDRLIGQRTLLTLGYRGLSLCQPWHTVAPLFARILPSPVALEAAIAAGFSADRLIALRPPISPELETALWKQWGITQVITKASGQPGGEATKRAIAAALGVRLVVITRPAIAYPAVTTTLADVVDFVWQHLTSLTPTPGSAPAPVRSADNPQASG